jgi:hypothetical protein
VIVRQGPLAKAVLGSKGDWIGGVSVSPDGRTIIFGRAKFASDLMMIENFR